jgi:hypothetical protein
MSASHTIRSTVAAVPVLFFALKLESLETRVHSRHGTETEIAHHRWARDGGVVG